VTTSIVRLLRFASIAICLIVIASFATFAVQQTKSASGHQQAQLNFETTGAQPPTTHSSGPRESSVHKALDEASNELTSPFAGLVSGTSSEWTIRGVKLLLALAIYGFGLGFLARFLRVRT
jgi:hypothetical protein